MSSRSILLVLVIFTCLQFFTTANNAHGPKQCCFDYQLQQIPARIIKAYRETERQCIYPGVIFILNKGRQVCADPGVEWVKERMEQIDQLNVTNPTQPKTTV
ncbi:C-C motif chemokine 3-like [Clarias gariepinus]|uniref:C-C motif chemokine 3-like n=1 Tax=Clarias gariepinus TaxID=13013 RepID=UPI00234D39CD|nr:C-C motif chemokine 3-like [Clarias gariepinus]